LETSLYWLSEDIVRFKIEVGVEEKCTKMLTPFPMDFPHMPEHAVIINDVIIVGRRLLHTYITRRCVCKRVHHNIIVYLADICTLGAPSSFSRNYIRLTALFPGQPG